MFDTAPFRSQHLRGPDTATGISRFGSHAIPGLPDRTRERRQLIVVVENLCSLLWRKPQQCLGVEHLACRSGRDQEASLAWCPDAGQMQCGL